MNDMSFWMSSVEENRDSPRPIMIKLQNIKRQPCWKLKENDGAILSKSEGKVIPTKKSIKTTNHMRVGEKQLSLSSLKKFVSYAYPFL
jgi:hypothetical protein